MLCTDKEGKKDIFFGAREEVYGYMSTKEYDNFLGEKKKFYIIRRQRGLMIQDLGKKEKTDNFCHFSTISLQEEKQTEMIKD